MEVEARPLPPPVANGGVGGGASSETPPVEPIVDERFLPLLPSIGGSAGEDRIEGVERRELLLWSELGPGGTKLIELAARVLVGMDAEVSSEGRGAMSVDNVGRGGLCFDGESCE